MEMSDIKEVEDILNDLRFLRRQMGPAVANWKSSKPNCEMLIGYMDKGILKSICEAPRRINQYFDPLIKWLSDYILYREGRGQLPEVTDQFLKYGLRLIHAFVIIAEFFERNPQYFVPDPPIKDLSKYRNAQKQQRQYQEFLNLLVNKLIGCNRKLSFLFLDLSKTITNLPEDLVNVREYLDQQCNSLRVRRLKY